MPARRSASTSMRRPKPRTTNRARRAGNAALQSGGPYPRPVRAIMPANHLPSGQKFSFRYADSFSLNPAAGSYASQTFRANDLYDPDFTGAGAQPMGFDQVMAWYDHFCVVRSRIKVTAGIGTATTIGVSAWGVGLFDDSSAANNILGSGSLEGMVEQGHGFRIGGTSAHTTGPRSNWTMGAAFDFKNFFGSQANASLAEFRGSVSASPTEQAYFTVWVVPWDGSSDIDTTRFLVEIDFDAILTEPKNLARS